jgi:hypothetical protein
MCTSGLELKNSEKYLMNNLAVRHANFFVKSFLGVEFDEEFLGDF